MGITFDKSKTMAEVLAQAMEWHPLLKNLGVRVEVLEASNFSKKGINRPALKDRRREVLAKTKVIPLERRVLGEPDALILVDRAMWQELSETQGLAAMDHELEHLEVLADKAPREKGTPVVEWITGNDPEHGTSSRACALDDHNRPRLRIKTHDWELGGFVSVTRRHRDNSPEKREAKVCLRDGQYMWDWADTFISLTPPVPAEVPKDAPTKKKKAG